MEWRPRARYPARGGPTAQAGRILTQTKGDHRARAITDPQYFDIPRHYQQTEGSLHLSHPK